MSIAYYPSDDNGTLPTPSITAKYIITLKRMIFQKWKAYCVESSFDHWGNEYYLANGVIVYHITHEGRYKFNIPHSYHLQSDPVIFDPGYYVMSTKRPNYLIIDDPDILHFILNYDMNQCELKVSDGHKVMKPKSLHKELKRLLGIDLFEDSRDVA